MSEHKTDETSNDLTIRYHKKSNIYYVSDCNKNVTHALIPEKYDDGEHGVGEVMQIGREAFADCKNLKFVFIPETIKTIEQSAFVRCVNLEIVHINAGLERISYNAFRRCENIKQITLPISVREIEPNAFKDSSKIAIKAYKIWTKNYIMRSYLLEA
ncbi:MAG: hypothetical protein CVV59_01010 [Tenericutes bacterium HGW-Tenericutes-4]|nr:MAG: hypothetical protein CVV59_01010 [Tenericutes bacterium HGW-Tenericutes-4]